MAEEYKNRIVNYLKKNLLKGYTPETLKWALINQGYSRSMVEMALDVAQKDMAKKAPVLKEKPKIKYEILDEYNNPIEIKKPWWKRVLGM